MPLRLAATKYKRALVERGPSLATHLFWMPPVSRVTCQYTAPRPSATASVATQLSETSTGCRQVLRARRPANTLTCAAHSIDQSVSVWFNHMTKLPASDDVPHWGTTKHPARLC